MAAELHEEGLSSLSEFGMQAQRLRELADFIVIRKY